MTATTGHPKNAPRIGAAVDTQHRLTDIQYAVYECGLSIDAAAVRIGTTHTKILQELATTPIPSWFRRTQGSPQGTGP